MNFGGQQTGHDQADDPQPPGQDQSLDVPGWHLVGHTLSVRGWQRTGQGTRGVVAVPIVLLRVEATSY
jgi:hypothetical protein